MAEVGGAVPKKQKEPKLVVAAPYGDAKAYEQLNRELFVAISQYVCTDPDDDRLYTDAFMALVKHASNCLKNLLLTAGADDMGAEGIARCWAGDAAEDATLEIEDVQHPS